MRIIDRFTLVAGGLAIAALGLSGCANSAAVAGEAADTDTVYPRSAAQVKALADGTVDRAEYVAGFASFQACMAESGDTVEILDGESTIIEARYLAEASDDGTDDRCYQTEFKDVDESWQIAHQDERADAALLDACLKEHGLSVPTTRRAKVDALAEAGVDLGSCLGEG
ncbi:hypothetical protein ACEXOS_009975 [Herbiconiux sp. P16]|uniref:hypothetical protein n=1 Tax=Herbiconiux wuyangfengii TaxID=3342794 RepID=UPI0035B7E2C5